MSKQKSPFTALMGKRVLIPFPTVEKKSDIILTDSAQQSMDEELIQKYLRITILQAGVECERVKVGDEVFIPARCLAPGRADAVEINGEKFYIVAEVDIAGIY